ncbi:hypothetical protein FACS189451_00030 [Bacteroidia bacterium]|nr:hypothetical protein FACS189446_5650 [Bacteroidia bacterium]GHT60287.1 hypothetical protein FACS189451_00030 [Bacteroidia bacterium]
MNTTASITIDNGRVTIRLAEGNVWLTQRQIANLFGVFVSAAGANIRSILRSGVLREEETCRHQKTGNGGIMTLYNLEMITALAFRLNSHPAQQFRRWITGQAVNSAILWKIPGMEAMLN